MLCDGFLWHNQQKSGEGYQRKCTLMISFQEGWSGIDLETDFFVAGFLAVVEALAEAAFFVVLGRDLVRPDEVFFATAALSGAGEARGDGRGEDIVYVDGSAYSIRTMVAAERVRERLARTKTTRLYIRLTEPTASHHV